MAHSFLHASARLGRLCGLAALLGAAPVWAALGGDLASVQREQQAWGASSSQSVLRGASVYSLVLGNGVTVREYLDASGTVFAVGWEGPVLPDFERLLGPHFASYQAALQTARRGVSIRSAGLVLESGGMMRAFTGRAYLPAQLPSGITAQDIR